MFTTISKWGNSLALRIPRVLAAQMGISENSNVSLELDGDRIIVRRGQTLEEMLAQINEHNKHTLVLDGNPRGKELI